MRLLGDEDAGRAGVDHRRPAHAAKLARIGRPGDDVAAVAERRDGPRNREGRLARKARQGHAVADPEFHRRADPRRVQGRDGGGIADRAGDDALDPGFERGGEHVHHVAGAPRHAIVAVVEEEHGAVARPGEGGFRRRDGLRQRRLRVDEVPPRRPEPPGEVAGGVIGGRLRLGRDGDRDAGLAQVGEREAAEDRGGEHAGPGLRRARRPDGVPHRAGHAGVHAQGVGEHRRVDEGASGAQPFVEHAPDDGRDAVPGLGHVHVRIGLEARQRVALGHHARRDVAVEVEGDAQRHVRREGPDAGEELAFAVVVALGHHRPVQVEEDGVAAGADRVEDRGGERLEGVVRHGAARVGVRRHGHRDARAARFREPDEGAERRGGVPPRRQGRVAPERAEGGERGRQRREGVGLVVHPGGDDAHGGNSASVEIRRSGCGGNRSRAPRRAAPARRPRIRRAPWLPPGCG